MKCKRIQEILLTDYLDEKLSQADEQVLENHLNECVECSKFKSQLAVLNLNFWDNNSLEPMPNNLWEQLQNKIVKQKLEKIDFISQTKFIFPKFLFEAACGVAIVFIVYSFMTIPDKSILQNQSISTDKGNYLFSYLGSTSDDEGGYGTALEKIFLNTKS